MKLTTRSFSGKMLMFAKLSLVSFIYELIETFYFPTNTVKKIYQKNSIQKVYIYHVLTDTNSTCLKFTFIIDVESEIPENQFRNIIFEIIITSKIYDGFDLLHKHWEKFNAREKTLKDV